MLILIPLCIGLAWGKPRVIAAAVVVSVLTEMTLSWLTFQPARPLRADPVRFILAAPPIIDQPTDYTRGTYLPSH